MSFGDELWTGPKRLVLAQNKGRLTLCHSSFRGVFPLLFTPPWALHADMHGHLSDQNAIVAALERLSPTLAVIDLGPRAASELRTPRGWVEVCRHTRQLSIDPDSPTALPRHRLKQQRRFFREGGSVTVTKDQDEAWGNVLDLHQISRRRKELASNGSRLETLLGRISQAPWTFASVAHDATGTAIASGGFVILEDQTCVYSFGGQQRSPGSGNASVAMLLAAIEHAREMGCTTFDFGGSQDSGVDQFYSEFGAEVILLRRWVKGPTWFPTLFPSTWKVWTSPSVHASS